MQSEFPSVPQEAFQSTGRRVFPPLYVQNARSRCCPPAYRGDIFCDAAPDDMKRSRRIGTVRFEEYAGGNLCVWALPDTSVKIKGRYAAFADIGGTSAQADYSVIRIIDRYPLLHGGAPEMAATWRGHLLPKYFAWVCAELAEF